MGRSTSPVRFPIRLRMTQECGWRWMRLSNTFPLAPEGVRRHRVDNALVKSRQKAQTLAPPKDRRGRPSPAEPGECCELFAAQTGFAFLDANPKALGKFVGRAQSCDSASQNRHRGLHLRVFEMDCIGLPAQNLCVLGSLVATSLGERASAGAPHGLAHWAAEVESAPGAATEEAENAEIARCPPRRRWPADTPVPPTRYRRPSLLPATIAVNCTSPTQRR